MQADWAHFNVKTEFQFDVNTKAQFQFDENVKLQLQLMSRLSSSLIQGPIPNSNLTLNIKVRF